MVIINGWFISLKKKKIDFLPIIVIVIAFVVLKMNGDFDALISCFAPKAKLQENQQYENTNQEASKSGKSTAELIYEYQGLFNNAYSQKDYAKAISYGENLLLYTPNDSNNLEMMAYSYLELKDYVKSANYYNKVLDIDPNNTNAKDNLKYVSYYIKDNQLNSQINDLRITQEAPKELYTLVKTNLSPEIKTESEDILDLIWTVPNGQVMLRALLQNQIPINIVQYDGVAYFRRYYKDSKLLGEINIPVKDLENLNNKSQPARTRVYDMNSFMHEMGHAFYWTKYPQKENSLEEEMGVDMLGYNIANKIITGNYLTQKETSELSLNVLESLLADDHKNLPVYSGFSQDIKNSGMTLPYPAEYSDLVFMYKQLLAQKKTAHVPNLDKLANKPIAGL